MKYQKTNQHNCYIIVMESNTIATGNKTKKQIVLEKLNKVNLSKNEKFLILYLSGYKLNEENKLSLENYLQTKGIKKNSLAF